MGGGGLTLFGSDQHIGGQAGIRDLGSSTLQGDDRRCCISGVSQKEKIRWVVVGKKRKMQAPMLLLIAMR